MEELVINGTPYRLVEHKHISDSTQSSEGLPCFVLEAGYGGSRGATHHTFQNPSESRDITFTLTDGPTFSVKGRRVANIELQR